MNLQQVEESTENWLSQFVSSSRRVYRMGLAVFLEFLEEKEGGKWSPQKIVEERIKDLDKRNFAFEQRIIDFYKWLQNYVTKDEEIPFERGGKTYTFHRKGGKKLSDNTKQAFINGVRSYFAFNRLDLNLTTQQKRVIGKRAKLVEHDYRLSLTDIQKMAEVGSPKERFILLAGKDLGFRAIDFIALTQGAFARTIEQNTDTEPPYYLGETYTQKEGVLAYPFLTKDGYEASRIWLKVLETKGLRDDNQPMLSIRKQELTSNLNRMAKKAGIKTHGQRIRFHCLRKFLADKLSLKMSESKWKQIVGKQIDEGAYVSHHNLREGYLSVLDRIQTPTHNGKNSIQLKQLEQEFKTTINTMRTQYEKENKELKQTLKDLESKLTNMATLVNGLLDETKKEIKKQKS